MQYDVQMGDRKHNWLGVSKLGGRFYSNPAIELIVIENVL